MCKITEITYKSKCPECGRECTAPGHAVLASYPPQIRFQCDNPVCKSSRTKGIFYKQLPVDRKVVEL